MAPHHTLCDLKAMDAWAQEFASSLKPGMVITIKGNLGSGKTTLTTMICRHLDIYEEISSPTFTYLNIYDDKVAHFDLYRIKEQEAFFALGFEEYLGQDYITIIEWPEVIQSILPADVINIELKHHEGGREICLS